MVLSRGGGSLPEGRDVGIDGELDILLSSTRRCQRKAGMKVEEVEVEIHFLDKLLRFVIIT